MPTERPSSERGAAGDPSRIAMRVDRILAVTQLKGEFERLVADLEGPLVPVDVIGDTEGVFEDSALVVRARYEFRAVRPTDEGTDPHQGELLFVARGEFMVAYELDESDEPISDADLRAFAAINGRLNTIPYWREFLHNVLTRAGMPVYEVPPFNPLRIIERSRDAAADPPPRSPNEA